MCAMLGAIPDPDETAPAGETREERKRRLRRARDRRYRARQRALQNGEPEPEWAMVREPAARCDAEWDDDSDASDDDTIKSEGNPWVFWGGIAAILGVITAVALLPVRAAAR
jgi:hypothetical protein